MSPSSDALVVTAGPLSGQSLPLERRELVMGRDPACDLPLTPYVHMSRRHARLTPTSNGWKIEDLGSTNGIFLDGARIQEGYLKHGSRVKLGDFEALVRVYTAPPPRKKPSLVPPLVPPPIPGADSVGVGSPSVAHPVRKAPSWLWPSLAVAVLLVGAGIFLERRSTSATDVDPATQAKVRRALDTGDADDPQNTKANKPPQPATGTGVDTATQPTAPATQLAPPVNGRIAPATIAATKSATVLIMRPEGNNLAFGSGFVCGNGHQVITNRHVVADEGTIGDCILIFESGTTNERKVRVPASSITLANGTDQFSADLALLTLPDDITVPTPLPLGNSEDLSETDTTWVFGFPLGVQTLTLDQELPSVSVKAASIERVQRGLVDGTQAAKVLQIGSTVTHGNSGGPVLNAKGEVVGVISQGAEGTGISFAIPTVWIKRLLP